MTGTVAIRDGYATVGVDGYDADLGREVFAWKDFCSVDDPVPSPTNSPCVSSDGRRDGISRASMSGLSPASAELVVDGTPFEGDTSDTLRLPPKDSPPLRFRGRLSPGSIVGRAQARG